LSYCKEQSLERSLHRRLTEGNRQVHPLISHDIAELILSDRMRDADRRRLAGELPRHFRVLQGVRSALGLRVVSFGARLTLERDQEAAFLVGADRHVHLTGLGPHSST
jgi:hypothetical protein